MLSVSIKVIIFQSLLSVFLLVDQLDSFLLIAMVKFFHHVSVRKAFRVHDSFSEQIQVHLNTASNLHASTTLLCHNVPKQGGLTEDSPPGFLHTSFLALDPCRLNLKPSKNNTSFKKPYCACSFANLILAALFFRPTNGFCHITLPLCLLFLLKWPVS